MRKGKENQIIRFLLDNGKIRGAILDSSFLVSDISNFHNYGPVESLISGQAITAAALLSVTIKGQDRMRFSIECAGPISGLNMDFNAMGDVRGYLQNNPIKIEEEKAVTLDNLYGPGFLHVTKIAEGSSQPYTGSVDLFYPDLANNLAYYYLSSEQTPTAFNLSVDIGRDGKLSGSAGLFLQAMPDADEKRLENLQSLVTGSHSLYKELQSYEDSSDWIVDKFASYNPCILGLSNVRFFCPCSREQIQQFIIGLGKEQSHSFLDEEKKEVVINCHSCSTEYRFSFKELDSLF